MKNNTSKQLKLFIALVLVVLACMVAGSVLGKVDVMKRLKVIDDRTMPPGTELFAVEIEPVGLNANNSALADNVEFAGLRTRGVLSVREGRSDGTPRHTVVTGLLSILFTLASGVFVVVLVVFACKLPRGRILTRGNVRRVRWMGVTLLAMGLAAFFIPFVEYVWIEENVVLDGWRVVPPSLHPMLLVGMILCAAAEIMNLAGRLQREQELTI